MVKNNKTNGTRRPLDWHTIYVDQQDALRALHQQPERLRNLARKFADQGEVTLAKELEDLADEIDRISELLN